MFRKLCVRNSQTFPSLWCTLFILFLRYVNIPQFWQLYRRRAQMTSVVNFPTVPLSAEAATSAVAAILAAILAAVHDNEQEFHLLRTPRQVQLSVGGVACPKTLSERQVTLCLTKHEIMSIYRGVKQWFHALITSVLGGSGTALQAGRSRLRFPLASLEFFIDITLPAALRSWGRLTF